MAVMVSVIVASVATGCGTVHNLVHPTELAQEVTPGEPVRQIYGGVNAEWTSLKKWDYEPEAVPFALLFKAATCIDLPFTLIGDTLTLPYTIPADVRRSIKEFYFPDDTTTRTTQP
jgi:uncharacterized protein YceK